MTGSATRLTSLSMSTASSTSAVVTATAITASGQILSGHDMCVDGCPGSSAMRRFQRGSRHAIGKACRARVNRPGSRFGPGAFCQHEIYVTTATRPGSNQPDQPAHAARLGWVSGKDKRYLMSWVWLGCSAIALVLVLWAKHVA
jgi:hypothetical protein